MDELNTGTAEQTQTDQTAGAHKKTTFEETVQAVADDTVEAIDAAINKTAEFIGGGKNGQILGGAAVGVLAAVVLPISLVGGALLGGAYAAWRQSK